MRMVGPHLRLTNRLVDLFMTAQKHQLETFQCFLIDQTTHKPYTPSAQEITHIRQITNQGGTYYLHGSYTINLAEPDDQRMRTYYKEIELAQKIGFTHYVLHPGSFKFANNKEHALRLMAERLDAFCAENRPVKIVLENVAHGGKAIGGDLHDFYVLKQAMKYPDKIGFCIDTAHAYVYGYDLTTQEGKQMVYQQLEQCIGFENIDLIHCNDTSESLGSRIDQHEQPGAGVLGIFCLRDFTDHPSLRDVPIIMELPDTGSDALTTFKTVLTQWNTL